MSARCESWLFGSEATVRIGAIASKFRTLLCDEAALEWGVAVPQYVPLIAIRGRRRLLKDMGLHLRPFRRGQLVTSRAVLRHLADLLRLESDHGVSAIVPHDIGVAVCADEVPNLVLWAERLDEARRLLSSAAPWMGGLFDDLIDYVIPIVHRRDGLPVKRGFSTPLCFGAIFLSFEDRLSSEGFERVELAIDLAHEIGHHVLHTFQTADPILSSNLREPVYSSVRHCVRPAIMSMHAAVALGYMLEAVDCLVRASVLTGRELNFVDTFRNRYASEQNSGLSELEEKCSFTSLGQKLIDALRRQVDDRRVAAQPISCAPCLV